MLQNASHKLKFEKLHVHAVPTYTMVTENYVDLVNDQKTGETEIQLEKVFNKTPAKPRDIFRLVLLILFFSANCLFLHVTTYH